MCLITSDFRIARLNSLKTWPSLGHNNLKDFSKEWEAGGMKITRARDGVVRRCRAVANNGVGFWFDIDVRDVLVEGCICKENACHGIYVEISGGFLIRNSNSSCCRSAQRLSSRVTNPIT